MGTSLASPLARGLGYRAINLGERAFSRAEEALAEVGLRPRHYNVLATVAGDPTLSQRELSTLLGIDPNVMVGVIDDLERDGLARRERSTADRRRHVVVLTEEGTRVLTRGGQCVSEAEEDFFGALSPEERRRLSAMIGRVLGIEEP